MLEPLTQFFRIDAVKRARDHAAWVSELRDAASGGSGYANLGYGREGDLVGRQRALVSAAVGDEPLTGHWLDVGAGTCGPALQLLEANPTLRITALELDADLRASAPRHSRLRVLGGDADKMPWQVSTFDGLLCIEAAHQFRDLAQFAHQAWVVLKPGARLVIADLVEKREHTRLYDGLVREGLRRAVAAPHMRTSQDWQGVLSGLPYEDVQVENVSDQVIPNLADWASALRSSGGGVLATPAAQGLDYLGRRGVGGPFAYVFVRAVRIDEG